MGDNLDPQQLMFTLIAVIMGVTFHEFSHAFVAYRLGDPTAYREGRVSLNPIRHFDPIGGMMMFFLILGAAPLAWGRPVPIDVMRIQGGRRGMGWSSMAGPMSNLLLATIASLPWQFGLENSLPPAIEELLWTIIMLNIGLAAFNMLPLPPLDGFNTLMGFVPNGWATPLGRMRQPASGLLLLLILLPWIGSKIPALQSDINLLQVMVGPIYMLFIKMLFPTGGCCYMVHHDDDSQAA